MISRFLVRSGALVFPLLAPAAAFAQGVVIDHKEVECIVVGKYPKMNACFTPASLAKRPRVYFRPETLNTWYYVEMGSDAPCHSAALLRATSKLLGKRIFYYVDVAGGGSRTAEYGPVVVRSEEDCRDKAVAPLSATGPAAVVPPYSGGLFVGGGGGLSAGVVAGGLAAAGVVAGGAVLLTNDDSPSASIPATVPGTSPPATAPPATAPPETVPPGRGPALVVSCQATPRNGEAPLRVAFATFPSGGDGTYDFLWTFGDGGTATNPNPSHTFLTAGVFDSTVRVLSAGLTATCSRPITVTTPPGPGPSPSTSPSASPSPSPSPSPTTFILNVSLAGSGTGTVTSNPPGITCPGDCTETYAAGTVVTLTATPTSPPPTAFKQWTGDCTGTVNTCVLTMTANKNVVAHFELIRTLSVQAGGNSDIAGSVVSNPAGITCSWTGAPPPCGASAPFLNGNTVRLTVTTAGARVLWGGACAGVPASQFFCDVLMNGNQLVIIDTMRTFNVDSKAAPLAWSTQLEVPDGEGQVVMNGRIASSVRPGLEAMAAEGRTGANRIEAVLVRGSGRPGTWRFDFSGQSAFKAGSLRVVAGTVALITGDAVVFRLQGKPGERVVFTFEVDR